MRKKRLNCLIVIIAVLTLLLAAFIIFPSSAADSSSGNSKVKNFESQISDLQSQANALKKRLASTQSDIEATQQQLADLAELKQITESRIQLSEELIAELEAEQKQIEEEIKAHEEAIETSFASFLNRMRASYEEDTASYLELLFGSTSLVDFISRWDYVSAILNHDRKIMEEYRAEKEELENAKEEREIAINKQQTMTNSLEELQDELVVMQLDATTALAELKEKYANQTDEYQQVDEKLDEVNEELENYLEELARISRGEYSGEGMIWPLPGFNYITSYFGPREYVYKGNLIKDNHTGIDIAGSGCYGKPIVAAASGTVIRADEYSSYGLCVIIDHGGGIYTLYAHASVLKVTKGQEVAIGDTIALVGATGQVTGAHLHFEVRVEGKAVDPLKYGYVVVPTYN